MRRLPSWIAHLVDHLGPGIILAMGLLLLLALAVGVFAGRYSALHSSELSDSMQAMRGELAASGEALKAARGDLEMQRTRHEVDSRALELLRSEMAAQKERIAELEEGLGFYRNMVVSEGMASGISLRKPELVPGADPRHVKYRFFIQQKERESEMVEGTVSVEVYGVSGAREVSYPLDKLSTEFNTKAATLHFRFFQAIEGELMLPEGFEAQGLKFRVRASKPRSADIREKFPWELQERFINVGN